MAAAAADPNATLNALRAAEQAAREKLEEASATLANSPNGNVAAAAAAKAARDKAYDIWVDTVKALHAASTAARNTLYPAHGTAMTTRTPDNDPATAAAIAGLPSLYPPKKGGRRIKYTKKRATHKKRTRRIRRKHSRRN